VSVGADPPCRFAIIGAGWRSEYFLRIAAALPDRFSVCGVLVRDPAKAAAFGSRWGVRTASALDTLLEGPSPEFVLVSVPRKPEAVAPVILHDLARRGIPALCETPPAGDLEGLIALWRLVEDGARIQVAEQYLLQPHHAARLALIDAGLIGRPTYVHASFTHEYHALSMIRRILGVGFDSPEVSARLFSAPLVSGPDRDGNLTEERVAPSAHTLATFDFGDRLALYDFAGDQYFSWVRGQRILVRGERGEMLDDEVRHLVDHRTPVTLTLRREDAGQRGNLEGYHHKGIVAGAGWAYRNPFAPARLSDDEIAGAGCLAGMARYVRDGTAFYDFAEAAQDQYLSLLMLQARETGRPVRAAAQPWDG
jgi:predicted dehydrogenase